jgi:hypothetical protein
MLPDGLVHQVSALQSGENLILPLTVTLDDAKHAVLTAQRKFADRHYAFGEHETNLHGKTVRFLRIECLPDPPDTENPAKQNPSG